jgi:hypothetical protein
MVALTSAQIRLIFLCRLANLDRDTVLLFYSENKGGG